MRHHILPELNAAGGMAMRMGPFVPPWAANLGYLHVEEYQARDLLSFRGYDLTQSTSSQVVDTGAANRMGVLCYYARSSDSGLEVKIDQPLLVDGISPMEYTNQFLFDSVGAGAYEKNFTRPAWFAADLVYPHLELDDYAHRLRYGLGDDDRLSAAVAQASASLVVTSNLRDLRLYEDYLLEFRDARHVLLRPEGGGIRQGGEGMGAARVRVYLQEPMEGEVLTATYNRTRVVSAEGQDLATYLLPRFTETLNFENALTPVSLFELPMDRWNDHYAFMSDRIYINVDSSERMERNGNVVAERFAQIFQLNVARQGHAADVALPSLEGARDGDVVRFSWDPLASYDMGQQQFQGYQVTLSYPDTPAKPPVSRVVFEPFLTHTSRERVAARLDLIFLRDGTQASYLADDSLIL